MINFLRQLRKPKYTTLNLVKIRANNIINNFNYLKSLQPTAEIFPVLKSNAYGHGLKELCLILNKTEAPMIAVDSFPEAQIAHRYFKRKILIISEMPLKTYSYCDLKRTEFVVYNEETLRHISSAGKKVKIHLFVNTGMNREGIKDLPQFINNNKKYLDKVEVTGLCSHLASATLRSDLNRIQERNFNKALDILRATGFFPRWIHLGNSAFIFEATNKILTAFRPGLSLYGYSPSNHREADQFLQPALSIYSQVVSLQNIQAGESVSYDEDYRVVQPTKIAIIPFGYYEGLPRNLSNKATLLFTHRKESFWAPVAGLICMNLTCCDVANNETKLGDRVQIISMKREDPNSLRNLSELANLIPYEFLVKIQGNIRREIIWD